MFKVIYWIVFVCLYPFYRYRFENRERIPENCCLLCANHSTNSDAVFLVMANGPKGDYGFMAKEELFHIPVLRWIIRWLHAFPVKRGNGDMKAIRTGFSILKANKKLLIFPEGTRVQNGLSVRTGEPVQPKNGAVIFATRAHVPMVPVYIPEGKKLFRRNIIRIGEPYFPECTAEKPSASDYQMMTDELMRRIYAMKTDEVRA